MLTPLPPLRAMQYSVFEKQSMLNEFFLTKDMNVFIDPDAANHQWYRKVDSGEWNYDICLLEEFGELIGSLPLAHYRSKKMTSAQIDNAVMELVDLKHFVMSKVLYLLWHEKIGVYDEEHWKWVNPLRRGIFPEKVLDIPETEADLKRDLVRAIIHATMSPNGYHEVLRQFYRIVGMTSIILGVSPHALMLKMRDIYELKFRLNIFRQLNGAATGQYRKVILGVEDNAELLRVYRQGASDIFSQIKMLPVDSIWQKFYESWEGIAKNG